MELSEFRSRQLIRVYRVSGSTPETQVVKVIAPSWDPHTFVRFPLTSLSPELQDYLGKGQLRPRQRLIATGNLNAKNSTKVALSDFEIPLKPPAFAYRQPHS